MSILRSFILTLILCSSFQPGNSQSAFELLDSLVVLEKTIDFENVHWYGEIINVADTAEISMQWKLRTPGGIPSSWLTNFDAGTNDLLYVEEGDSMRFNLFHELEFYQKLIIGVEHNGETGFGRYEFDIFPRNDREDLKTQIYEVSFTELTSTTDSPAKTTYFPEDLIYLTEDGFLIKETLNNLNIFTLDGRLLYNSEEQAAQLLNISIHESILIVGFEYKGKRYTRKFLDFR